MKNLTWKAVENKDDLNIFFTMKSLLEIEWRFSGLLTARTLLTNCTDEMICHLDETPELHPLSCIDILDFFEDETNACITSVG